METPVEIVPSLKELEAVIDRNLSSFYEVGKALRTIQGGQLYEKLGYDNFRQYVEARWDFGWNYGYKQMAAAAVQDNLCTIVQKPLIESQAREFARLADPEQQRQVARDLGMDNPETKVTTAVIRAVIAPLLEHSEPKQQSDAKDTLTLSIWHADSGAVKRALWALGFKGGEGAGSHLRLGKEGLTEEWRDYYVNSRVVNQEDTNQ